MKKNYSFVVKLVLFYIAFFCSINGFSQAPGIEWQNTIGGDNYDYLLSIQQTTDGGYILGGYSSSNISGDKTENSQGFVDYWVVKLDASGNIQWQNTIGSDGNDNLYSIQQTSDGGYILGGSSISGINADKTEASQGGYDYWVIKLDASGNIQWQNTIGGSDDDFLTSIQQTADGGYFLGGYSSSGISGDKTEAAQLAGVADYWVVKLDASGNIQWQNTIGGTHEDYLRSIQQTTDEGYVLGGHTLSGLSGDKTEASQGNLDNWVVKLDASGNIQWQNTIGGNFEDQLFSLQQTTDGGYILGSYSGSEISGDKTEEPHGAYDYWVVKLDTAGSIQWQNTIGGSDFDYLLSIQQSTDGGYILGGYSNTGISGDKTEEALGGNDYWVVKLDTAGNILWQNTIGGSDYDYLISIQQTTDEGYILGGNSYSSISGDKTEDAQGINDYWVLKLEGTGVSIPPLITNTMNSMSIYPNPANATATIDAQLTMRGEVTVRVYDIQGNSISSTDVVTPSLHFNHTLSLDGMANGIYLVEIEVNGERQMQKLSVIKN